jgi:SPP1 family predicted phage head-tail adaptor
MSTAIGRLNSGDLRAKITILRADVLVDRGEPTVTGWSTVATPWAEVTGQSGREAVIARALEGISVYRIRIRWRRGLLPSDQVRLSDGTDLNIKSIADPDGRREQLLILADTDGAQKTT